MTEAQDDIELYDGETIADAYAQQDEDDDPESLAGNEVVDDLGEYAEQGEET